MMRLLASGVFVLSAVALVCTTAAAADSLVFIRSNNVWIANANGSNAHRVTRDGTARYPYESP
jgi:Dipeptidyl peptidase IV (DPP IV) N-terminal region